MPSNSSCNSTKHGKINLLNFYLGLFLAILSCFIMSWSYIVKKLSLNRLVISSGRRAGDGGYGYLKDWMWWLGLILMGAGEIINSVAYGFAPASLVTPLGALSVLFTALLSAKILDEHLNLIGKIGCMVSLCGSTIVVIHAPKEQLVTSIDEFTKRFIGYGFLTFLGVVIAMVIILLVFIAPKYGKRNPMVYIVVSSSVGSISVMSVKGIGVFVKELLVGKFIWNYWIVYVTFAVLILGLLIQINYLNKALDLFNANIVTPIIYVCFTLFVIGASSILLEEWADITLENCLGIIDGFVLIILGFLLLYLFKDMNVTWRKTKVDFFNSLYKDNVTSTGVIARGASYSPFINGGRSSLYEGNDVCGDLRTKRYYSDGALTEHLAETDGDNDKMPFLSAQEPRNC